MSFSSSRRSQPVKQKVDDGEFFLECKAAYLSVFDDLTDRIGSKKDLQTVLQQSGRNPSNRTLEKHWPRHTDDLSFHDFVDICRKEPVTTVDDLMKAFRKIDTNGDGYISLDELHKIMNTKGETMSIHEVRKMIDEVDENRDGRLDYGEFCNMIMKTTNECKKMSMKVMERKERKKKGKMKTDSFGTEQEKHKNDSTKQPHHEQQPHSHSSKHSAVKGQSVVPKTLESAKKSKHTKTPRDAEQVEEDIQENDDLDIISPGRPTPKIDLKSTPRRGTSEDKLTDRKSKGSEHDSKSPSNHKGKLLAKDTDALHALQNGERMGSASDKKHDGNKSKEGNKSTESKSDNKADPKNTTGISIIVTADDKSDEIVKADAPKKPERQKVDKNETEQMMEEDKSWIKPEKKQYVDDMPLSARIMEEDKSSKPVKKQYEDDMPLSSRIMDQIFKTSARSHREFLLELDEMKMEDERKSSISETKPPLHTVKDHSDGTPRREVHVASVKDGSKETIKEKASIKKEEAETKINQPSNKSKLKENGFGSQSSLRSGDIGLPVPSPRKTHKALEDEVPRPSPRIRPRDQKTKSSTKGRDKLPDLRTLRDWFSVTSKGCFFYEDDEIVTHVYNLKLTEDSAVYFTAYPLQEPASLALPSGEPVDTALYILDNRGKLVSFTEQQDSKGRYGLKCDLNAGEYQVVPYTTGCRFKQRTPNEHVREAKLVKKDKDDKIVITSAFRKALEDIFDLCDLDDNGTMSKDEFNWFNLRTSGEELGADEWEVVEERTSLENGEITKRGFIELNEMEAEDSQGDVEDLWITLTSMGLNKALIMDEACPYRLEVYVERTGRREPRLKVTGIDSLQRKELVQEIGQSVIEKSQSEPVKIRNMKDLYMHTYKNDNRATIALENRSRSRVNVEIDCNKSKNAVSHRDSLDHNVEVEPQSLAIAHHLMPAREGADWTVICTESILK